MLGLFWTFVRLDLIHFSFISKPCVCYDIMTPSSAWRASGRWRMKKRWRGRREGGWKAPPAQQTPILKTTKLAVTHPAPLGQTPQLRRPRALTGFSHDSPKQILLIYHAITWFIDCLNLIPLFMVLCSSPLLSLVFKRAKGMLVCVNQSSQFVWCFRDRFQKKPYGSVLSVYSKTPTNLILHEESLKGLKNSSSWLPGAEAVYKEKSLSLWKTDQTSFVILIWNCPSFMLMTDGIFLFLVWSRCRWISWRCCVSVMRSVEWGM